MSRKRNKLLVLIGLLICACIVVLGINKIDTPKTILSTNHFENLKFSFDRNAGAQKVGCYYFEDIYYVFLPSFVEPGELTVSYPDSTQITFASGQDVVKLQNNEKSNVLQEKVTYDIEFIDIDGNTQQCGKLMFMKSQNLPAMFIDTESGSLDYLNQNKENREPGNMSLYSDTGMLEWIGELTHMTGRGNQTWTFDKKSYSIKLENKADLFGMGEAKDWVLLCNVYDRSYIRNKITYEMAIASGMGWAPQSQYIDLYVNEQYHGLYQLCEKVEIDSQRINIRDLEEANELTNPGTNLSELQRIVEDDRKGYLWEKEPKDITGGYLVERDYGYKYDEALSGFVSPILRDQYTIKSPDRVSEGELKYISALFEEMEEAVIANNGINTKGKHYTEYIDVKSFANKYVIEELTRNDGGGATSAFYYKPEDSKSNLIFAGPVWDYDKAYGRVEGIESNTRDLCFSTLHFDGTLLYYYLYKQPEFYEEVKKIYRDFYSDYLGQLADGDLILSYCEEIEKATQMDNIRWNTIVKNASYKDEAEEIRKFIEERKGFLDVVWVEETPIHVVELIDNESDDYTYLGVIDGEKMQSLPIVSNTTDKEFRGWFKEDSQKEFNIETAITEDVSVIAVWDKIH